MTSVVVLTSQYRFWEERPLKKALKLIVTGKVEVVVADESREIRAGISRDGIAFRIPFPLVIRLLNFVGIKVKREDVHFSKEAVFERDGYTCQYWHRDDHGKKIKYRCTKDDLTMDHILPRCKGGENTFTNTVTACRICNGKLKKGRTPQEAGLELIRQPMAPKRNVGDWVIIRFNFNPANEAHQALQKYMGDYGLAT